MLESIAVGYRATIFSLYGLGEFTSAGFAKNALHFKKEALDVDLTAKHVLITGANSGLGFSAAKAIATKGATVHLLCRNKERGETASNTLRAMPGIDGNRIVLHVVDVASVRDVKRFASEWAQTGLPIHVLINNAGILPNERSETQEGLESTFATNTMGTYSLTTLLLPFLKKAETPRVVNVSSGGAFNKRLNVTDIAAKTETFNGALVYAQTKRQQIELTEYWAKQYPEIQFLSMHPGWAHTPGVESSIPGFFKTMEKSLRTSDEGADTIVWAAVAEEAKAVRSGALLFDRKETSPHVTLGGTTAAPGDVEKLVQICSDLLNKL
ncbi:member 12 [Chytriomyces cf. hyalinus JEL632]|nr:member 12 [Chytriomyces cf. hyalinus JEL632]